MISICRKLDGYKICARIKQNQETRDIPVLFLSGFEETFDIVKGFNAGAIDYITKPVATDELMVRVQTHLSQLSRHRELLETNVALVTENREYIVNEARLKARVAELEQELRLKEYEVGQMTGLFVLDKGKKFFLKKKIAIFRPKFFAEIGILLITWLRFRLRYDQQRSFLFA